MQFWCPDVYEGAPTPITAYLSVGPKIAGFAVLLRLLTTIFPADFVFLIALLSAVTMTWGNLVALRQTNIKRLLAYSSIAQAGYILIGLVSATTGPAAVIYYSIAYAFANIGVFALVIYWSLLFESEDIESFAGLSARSPALAAALSVFFLSLIGIPPLAGFVGKFLVFKAAIGAGYLWLAVLGVLNSVVSVYYYLNIVRLIYFQPGEETPLKIPALIALTAWLSLGVTFLLGIFPHLVAGFMKL
jgi:NADH-quinone oxidoreductase subunit N